MKIGLIDVDGHFKKKKWGATVYPNLALAKIARYHKEQGDEVEWALPFEHYDRVYMSKVFNFSPDDLTVYNADEVIRGGTGYDIKSQLPDEIDRLQPDYSIYPMRSPIAILTIHDLPPPCGRRIWRRGSTSIRCSSRPTLPTSHRVKALSVVIILKITNLTN